MSAFDRIFLPLFVVLIVMAFAWFYAARRLRSHLRDHHPELHDEMELERMFHRHNARPTMAVLRFLWRREYMDLQDETLERLGAFMRRLGIVYFVLFSVLFVSVVVHLTDEHRKTEAAEAQEAATGSEGSAQMPESAQLRRAFDLHRAGKYAQAVAVYDDIEGAGGGTAEVLYWRALAHWHLQQTEPALRDLRAVIRLEPGNLDAHRHADRIMSSQKRWDEVLQLWHGYLAAVPRDAEGYFERGGTYYRKGDLASAREDASRACELGKQQACDWVKRLEKR